MGISEQVAAFLSGFKEKMKSPITGKEMKLSREKRIMHFRKEPFEIAFHYYKDTDSSEQFTSTDLDELNIRQVYNQYREKYNIPFPKEIEKTRETYSLSAAKMSEILGLGTNGYRQYEAGEMPSVSNAKLIRLAEDPKNFMEMVALCSTIDKAGKDKIIQKAQALAEEKKRNIFNENFKEYLLGNYLPGKYSGYRNPDFEKFSGMVIFFAQKLQPFKTKINKLLFYADFLMFKRSCFSISGVQYRAIDMGPVPNNFQSIFEYLGNTGKIEIHYKQFSDGGEGAQFKSRKDHPFQPVLFSDAEMEVLNKVAATFKNTSTHDMIQLSHLEEGWKKNEKKKSNIDYLYAFELNSL